MAVISDISNEHASDIKNNIPEFDYKQYQVLGNLTYQDTKITYGHMDEELGAYLGFQLIYGAWPKSAEQIVIEEYLVEKIGIDIHTIPCTIDSISFSDSEIKKSYEVTGIISNYSSNLSVNPESTSEINVYPSVICGGRDDTANISLVVSQKTLNFKTADDDIWYFLSKYRQLPSNTTNQSLNEKLTWHGYDDLKDIISSRYVHFLLLYLFLLITEFVIVRVFLFRNKSTFYILKALGLSAKKKKIMLVWLISLFVISALLLSYVSVNIFNTIYINRSFPEYKEAYNRDFIRYFIIQLITAFALLSILLLIIIKAKDLQIIEGIRKVKITNTSLTFKKTNINMIFMNTVLLFCIIASMNFMIMFKTDYNIEYNLYSKKTYSNEFIDTYRVASYKNRYYPFSTLDILKKYREYLNISTEGEALQFSMLVEKDNMDPYIENLIETDMFRSLDNNNSYSLPQEATNYSAIPTDQFVIKILPNKEFHEFLNEHSISITYTEPDSLTDKELTCIMVLPNYNVNYENASVSQNKYINIGGLKIINDEISFLIERFKVEHLITPVTSEWMPIQMVISEEAAKRSTCILGYDNINIKVKDDIPDNLLHEIDNCIYSIASSIQGGLLGSTLQAAMENKLLKNYTNLLSYTILIFSIMSVIIYIILSTYINWENNKHEYGVLRSFGMSYHALQHKLFIQFTTGLLISTLIASLLGYMAFPGKGGMTLNQVVISVFVAFIITYICRIVLYFIYKKQTISSMITNSL